MTIISKKLQKKLKNPTMVKMNSQSGLFMFGWMPRKLLCKVQDLLVSVQSSFYGVVLGDKNYRVSFFR